MPSAGRQDRDDGEGRGLAEETKTVAKIGKEGSHLISLPDPSGKVTQRRASRNQRGLLGHRHTLLTYPHLKM